MDNDYLYHCRGCKKPDKEHYIHNKQMLSGVVHQSVAHHRWARADAYGIYTGLYCDDCYKDNYPYRKDEYYDPAYAGERMEPDE